MLLMLGERFSVCKQNLRIILEQMNAKENLINAAEMRLFDDEFELEYDGAKAICRQRVTNGNR